MKAVLLMFDSLNRHMLSSYGCSDTHTPNFQRLAERCVTFDTSYVCSMPCMPARRDMHTGRPNFLHRSWSPLEVFDDSVPEMLKRNGVSTHLMTDHYHYWEDGGSTYHNRFSTYRFFRGQEGDPWMGQAREPEIPQNINGKGRPQDWINRQFIMEEPQWPQRQTIDAGLEFLDRNAGDDNWFLQIETFDPHEPFFAPEKYKDLYPDNDYDGPLFDWPGYRGVTETPEQVAELQRNYKGLLSFCDAQLGRVLDKLDEHGLWEDTLFMVCTDHGFLLGEHDCWAKNWMPLYEEIAHTPFFVWDPRSGKRGERRQALVQPAIDIPPTLLRYFGFEPTEHMTGHDLAATVANDTPVRDTAIFGYHGQWINITDGRHVYMRAPEPGNRPLSQFTLMHTMDRHGGWHFQNLHRLDMAEEPFSFTKGARLTRIPLRTLRDDPDNKQRETLLFDVVDDPQQQNPLPLQDHPEILERLTREMIAHMKICEAPAEQYERMGLEY